MNVMGFVFVSEVGLWDDVLQETTDYYKKTHTKNNICEYLNIIFLTVTKINGSQMLHNLPHTSVYVFQFERIKIFVA